MRARSGAVAALVLLVLTGCGSTALPVMPEVVGLKLDVALSDIKRAGIDHKTEVIGGGVFGIIDESNWMVCSQEPAGGQSASSAPRVTVDRSCPDLASPTPAPTTIPTPTDTPAAGTAAFVAVIDGDTISTSIGTVRIIGIDAPERGQCGFEEASQLIGRLVAPGDTLSLDRSAGQNDRDRHDRLLRHVVTAAGVDLGLAQVQAGHAIARYDSSDGYPAHPHEQAYRTAQTATLGADGVVVTLACKAEPTPSIVPVMPQPAPTPELAPESEPEDDEPWWQQYSSCAKLKKNTNGHPTGPFRKDHPTEGEIYDWFAHGTGNRGDGDDDGRACE